jgi:hypothetical protein
MEADPDVACAALLHETVEVDKAGERLAAICGDPSLASR